MRRTTVRLWRWRRNPLRRPSDVAEAWIILITAVLVAVAAPLVALTVSRALDHPFQQMAREQRHSRHPVSAVLLEDPSWESSLSAETGSHTVALVRWKAPDGTLHRDRARVPRAAHRGGTATVWTDARGRQTDQPMTAGQARMRADVCGVAAGAVAGGVVVGGRLVVTRRVDRARMAQWDQELSGFDPHRNR